MQPARPHTAKRVPLLAFPLAAAAIYAVTLTLAWRAPSASHPGPIAWGILGDLLVTVPALWLVLMVRGRGVPWSTVFPVWIASFAAASLALPPAIRPGRLGLEAAIAVVELVAVAAIGIALARGLRRARAAGHADGPGEIPERIAATVRHAFGIERLAEIFAFEVATLVYAAAGWRMKPASRDPALTAYRECGWPTGAIGLGLVLLVETFPVHVLAARANPVLAWVLTASSAYALIWLVGDFQALRLRPSRLEGDALALRLGLRWSARIPWESIREARALRPAEAVRGRRDTLRAVLMGDATVALELAEPVVAKGPYGFRRRVTRIEIAPDDPRAFLAALGPGIERGALRRAASAASPEPTPQA